MGNNCLFPFVALRELEVISHTMCEQDRRPLALPVDVIFSLFEFWLDLKDIVRFDSAICEHSLRSSFLEVIAKCPLHRNRYVAYIPDECVRWRASRRIKGLQTLLVEQPVSDSFIANSTRAADVLVEVKRLRIIRHRDKHIARWFELVAPQFQNLTEIETSYLRFDDIDWLPFLAQCTNLTTLCLHFENKGYLVPDSVLVHFANCGHLRILKLRNYCCSGIETVLAYNNNLTAIILDCCDSMTDRTFTQILNLPHVQRIELSGNCQVVGDGAVNISTTTLRTLSLTHFHQLTEDNVLRILSSIPKPQTLSVVLNTLLLLGRAFVGRLDSERFKSVSVKIFQR
jgi:hypothetical protein